MSSNISASYIAADGLDIFYRSAGPVEAPVLLLLHGFPCVYIALARDLISDPVQQDVVIPISELDEPTGPQISSCRS